MSQRTIRVNELIKREISELLHTRYQAEATLITILEVDTSPDLRNAKVYYSVFGDATAEVKARRFLIKRSSDIRGHVARKVVLKYLPDFEFVHDTSVRRGSEISRILDELDIPEED